MEMVLRLQVALVLAHLSVSNFTLENKTRLLAVFVCPQAEVGRVRYAGGIT